MLDAAGLCAAVGLLSFALIRRSPALATATAKAQLSGVISGPPLRRPPGGALHGAPRGGCRACAHEELRDACGTSWARSAFRSARARWLPRPQRAQGQHESRLLSRQPRACQASVLCISLWIVSVNMLVNRCTAVDMRGCGKVDNRGEASPGRAPPSAVHRRSEVSTGQMCSLLFRRNRRG